MNKSTAFGVVVSGIAVYWLAVLILGTPLARDSVDIASIIMASLLAASLMPLAIDHIAEGGQRSGWKLLMGNVAYLVGWVFFCGWSYVLRAEGRPEWMVESPMNGFFKLWILGGIVLSYFGTNDPIPSMAPHRVYYVAIGVIVGILIGVAVSRYFGVG
jgi:hypothetical protein